MKITFLGIHGTKTDVLQMTFCLCFLAIASFAFSDEIGGLNEGGLVFSIRKPYTSRDGFRAVTGTLEKGRGLQKWWEFYQYDICTMNPDGSGFRQLTNDGLSRRPRWSHDRGRIAYISGVGIHQSLMIMGADGGNSTELVKKQYHIHQFWWSPAGDAILVVVEIDRAKDRLENWVVSVDGERTQRWRSGRFAKGWIRWNPDGKKVKEPRNRFIDAMPDDVSWPQWSPSREYLAFITNGVLATADVEASSGTGLWVLQRNEVPCERIEEWSPDGKQVLFYLGGEICVATVERGKFTSYQNLSRFKGRDATWSPDGKQIAFIGQDQGRRRTSEIFTIDVTSGEMRQMTHTNFDNFDLHWR